MNSLAQQALQNARQRLVGKPAARSLWSDDQVERLRTLYPDAPMPKLVAALGRTASAIHGKAAVLGLARSAAFMASEHGGRLRRENNPGTGSRFRPGSVPWNKGLRVSAGGRSVETRFAVGSLPHNNVPVGTERVTEDGIRQRKVRDDCPAHRRWKSVHSILWESVHGEIPPGHLVVFRDRNPQRIEIDNLELVTRAENMARNSIHRYPPELKSTIRQLAKLKRAISEASREE